MLTPKQNMLEVIKGGNPDRFVNQYEAVQLLFHPFMFTNPLLQPGQENVVNAWGVTNTFPKGVPGSFPVHTPDKIVVKDIEDWKDYVHAPSLKFTQDQWDMVKAQYDAVDGEQAFKAAFVAPGLFEQTHHLCEISNALVYYITNPDEMHDLIKYLTEWELELAEGICSNLHPDALFHHDDWGGLDSTFMSPAMFDEFIKTTIRTVTGIDVWRDGDIVTIRVTGTGFLYNMVRIISGTLIEVGNGQYPPERVKTILEACNREMAGPTAPAQGLTLMGIEFFD